MKPIRKIEHLLAAVLFVAVCVLFSLAHKDSKKLDSLYKKAVVQDRHQAQAPYIITTSKR